MTTVFEGCDYQCSLCGDLFPIIETHSLLTCVYVLNPLNGVGADIRVCPPCHIWIPSILNPEEDEEEEEDNSDAGLLEAMRNVNGHDLISMFRIEGESDEVLGFIPMNSSPILNAILALDAEDPASAAEDTAQK